jgi:hypothetical protein
MKREKIINQFLENNDLQRITDSVLQMLIRDMKSHPELYKNSDQDEDIVQLIRFVSLLHKNHLNMIELLQLKADIDSDEMKNKF